MKTSIYFFFPLIVLSSLIQAEGKKESPESTKLTARLLTEKKTYTLDQKTLKILQKLPDEYTVLPLPPQVSITLEIKNSSTENVTIHPGHDQQQINLTLKGPGARSLPTRKAFTEEFRLGKKILLKPGETYSIPLQQLAWGFRGESFYSFWTKPGKYTLAASLQLVRGEKVTAKAVELTVIN